MKKVLTFEKQGSILISDKRNTTQINGVIKMFRKITKEFLEENDINIAEDFAEEELERLFKKEFEDELEQQN